MMHVVSYFITILKLVCRIADVAHRGNVEWLMPGILARFYTHGFEYKHTSVKIRS